MIEKSISKNLIYIEDLNNDLLKSINSKTSTESEDLLGEPIVESKITFRPQGRPGHHPVDYIRDQKSVFSKESNLETSQTNIQRKTTNQPMTEFSLKDSVKQSQILIGNQFRNLVEKLNVEIAGLVGDKRVQSEIAGKINEFSYEFYQNLNQRQIIQEFSIEPQNNQGRPSERRQQKQVLSTDALKEKVLFLVRYYKESEQVIN
jgi:hypothetical protein